jgi:hypothetical protein
VGQETQRRLLLVAAVIWTITLSFPCHRYGAVRFVATETTNMRKDDEVTVTLFHVSFSNDTVMNVVVNPRSK